MKNLITKNKIKENSLFFWYSYLSCFRGFDDKKELNIDDVLQEVLLINEDDFNIWYKNFFTDNGKDIKYIQGQLNEDISFTIEFHKYEILFFINDEYIGSLGGHFEAWSLTLEEISYFQKFDFVFLLLLPMLGITKNQFDFTKKLISKNIKLIPELELHSDYIAECIANGLIMSGEFYIHKEIGIVNTQNHSVRNITKYPEYKKSIIKLNKMLKKGII